MVLHTLQGFQIKGVTSSDRVWTRHFVVGVFALESVLIWRILSPLPPGYRRFVTSEEKYFEADEIDSFTFFKIY